MDINFSRYDVTKIPQEKRREILNSHQDAIDVEVGGKEYKLFFGGITWVYNRMEDDVDLNEILYVERDITQEEALYELADLLHLGHLPFNDKSDPAEFVLRMSQKEYRKLQQDLIPYAFGLLDDAMSDELKEAVEQVQEEADDKKKSED